MASISQLMPTFTEAVAAVHRHFGLTAPAPPPIPPSPLTRVLCVDDDPEQLRSLEDWLSQAGAPTVESFASARALQQRLTELDTKQVLLLLDLHMPDMNGMELIQHLVGLGYLGHVAVIGRHDHRMLETAERLVAGYGLRWAGSLSSPVSLDKVQQILRACKAR